MLALLRKANSCDDEDITSQDITLYPLTQNKVLAEALCVRGAYQGTNYYAVLDNKLSKVEQVLAEQYNRAEYDEKQGYAFVRRYLQRTWSWRLLEQSRCGMEWQNLYPHLRMDNGILQRISWWRMAVAYFVSDIIVK